MLFTHEDSWSWEEFLKRFATEEDCTHYLTQLRWPDGFCCSRCSHARAYTITSRRLPLFQCASCGHQASLLAGTVMEGSSTDLRKWFAAFYLMSRPQSDLSALRLSRLVQVTYKTAWLMLHKIRHAIGQEDRDTPLSGSVTVHEACFGARPSSSMSLGKQEHPLLIGAVMDDSNQPVYVKMKLLDLPGSGRHFASRAARQSFMEAHTLPDQTTACFLTGLQYKKNRKPLFPFFHSAWHWANRVFHGLGRKHLQAYLNEFCYRAFLSQQKVPSFHSLTSLCLRRQRITYQVLTAQPACSRSVAA